MVQRGITVALSMAVAASTSVAAQPYDGSAAEPQASSRPGAPPAGPDARYCLRVDPIIGTRIATIRCETREGWAQLDVDVDKEWPTEGVRIINT